MNNPTTIYGVLQMLEKYDDQRRSDYVRLSKEVTEPQAQLFLDHLIQLEDHALKVLRSELEQLDPEQTTYLMSGRAPSVELNHSNDCRCDNDPSCQDILACALASAQLRGELLQRLEGRSAAPSVSYLAKRLRELEAIQGRQIANFTRED